MAHYPPANDYRSQATIYGPLPSHGFDDVALVLHTTETAGMPGFNNGATAPHYVYRPHTRQWDMWAEYEDGYVGTMRGHTTGGHSNCKAFQVEILAYSDGNHSPWVGDFTDYHYTDLADFYRWARDRYGIGDMVTPTPAGGWRYGTGSSDRLSNAEWATFSGLTAHGAVPNNTHWDTGVLDLARIHELATGDDDDMVTHYKIGEDYPTYEEISWLLFLMAGGTVDPNKNSSQVTTALPWKADVRAAQVEDFDMIADVTGMTDSVRARFKNDGLYRYGKEIAALRETAWNG